MGGRKQKKKLNLDWATKEVSTIPNFSVPARNLRKTDLGAVIFGCTHSTISECFSNQLFGLPEGHYSYIKNISQGLVLFLFNYSDRKLHGIFEAAGPGQMNIDQYAWMADGDNSGYTRYPAQVRIRVRQPCQPLSENEFGPMIAKNYYESKLFYFELDNDQKQKLIALFKPMLADSSVAAKWNNLYFGSGQSLPQRQDYNAIQNRQAEGGFDHASLPGMTNHFEPGLGRQTLPENLNQTSKLSYVSALGRNTTASSSGPTGNWRALFKSESDSQTTNDDRSAIQASNVSFSASGLNEDTDDCLQVNTWEESQPIATIWEDNLSHQTNTIGDELPLNEEYEDEADFMHPNTWEGSHAITITRDEAERDQLPDLEPQVEQVQIPDLSGQHLDQPSSSSQPLHDNLDCNLSSSVETSESENEEIDEKDDSSIPNTAAETSTTHAVVETSTDLQPLVVKLMQEVEVMKGSQVKQIVKINMLEEKLVESKLEIQQLRDRVSVLESGSRSVVKAAEVSRPQLMFAGSIFIVGGFDGSSWLTSLDSYSPSQDLKVSLSPMNFVKSYSSAATLFGEIYHFGGAESHTVESFNPTKNQWISRPPLYWKNIHVAGASIKDRLFVVGGAIGCQCSSEVEYLDLHIGKWLPARSMQSKRLAPAAAELKNVLYVAGGYDGVSYLSSFERFDPREEAWYKLPNMKTKKGCHSMVVLNEKLYTLGGFNGENYVPTVECFDTRMSAWVEAQPMNVPRGNFGAFVLGEKLYAIGGTKEKEELLDIVECYKEGSCWEVAANLKAIGKRSHFSAIVL